MQDQDDPLGILTAPPKTQISQDGDPLGILKKKDGGNDSRIGVEKSFGNINPPERVFGIGMSRKSRKVHELAPNEIAVPNQGELTTTQISNQNELADAGDTYEQDKRKERIELHKKKVEFATPAAVTSAAKKSLQIKGINPNNTVLLNKEKQSFEKQLASGEAEVGFNSDGSAGLIAKHGGLHMAHKNMMDAINTTKESREFKDMTRDERIAYADKKEKEAAATPYIGEKTTEGGEFLGMFGGAVPTLGLYGAGAGVGTVIEATGGATAVPLAPIMTFAFNAGNGANARGMQGTMQRYYENLNRGMSKEHSMELATKGEDIDRLAGIGETALFSAMGGKAAKTVTGGLLKNIGKEAVKGGAVISGIEGLRDIGHNLEGDSNKSGGEILKNMGKALEENAPMLTLLPLTFGIVGKAFEAPKIIRNAIKYDAATKLPPEQLKAAIDLSVEQGVVSPELANKTLSELQQVKNVSEKLPDGLSDEAKASVTGLILKRDNLKKEVETKDESAKDLHNQEVESINNQIKEIYRTGKPLEHEINEVTGETYKQPTFDDVQKSRVEDLADKIAKGKRIEDPEHLQAQVNFPEELEKELNRIKKSETPKEDETQSDAFKNVNKYLKKNEQQATETQTQEEATPTQSESTENKTNEISTEEKITEPAVSVENKAAELWDKRVAEGGLGVFSKMPKDDGIKMVAEQAQNVSRGKVSDNKSGDAYRATVNQFGKPLVDAAIEKHPLESLIEPSEKVNQENTKVTLEGESKPPPAPPIENVVEGNIHKEYPPTSLSYSGTGKIETEFGVEERLPTKTKHDIETIKQADNLLEDGWNVKDALNKIENEAHTPSDAEYINMTRYAAELSGRLRSMDINSKDYDATLNELNRVSNASNIAGKEQGRALGIRGRFKTVQDGTYADFMLTELNANNDAPLTEKQKETAQKDFSQLDEAKVKFDADKKAFEDKVAAFKAEHELVKQKKTASTGKRKNHEDLVKERQEIFTSISDKLKKARSETSATFVPYANELIAIAPDVLKLARNLVEDGVVKLEEVLKAIHPQLKGDMPDLQERDIHDILAGEYTKKKQTKSEVAKRMEDLRIEAGLINRLESIEKAVPKTEKEKVKRNQEIEKLRNQIKDYKKEEADANKFFGEEKNPERAALESLKNKNIKETERIKEKIRTFDYEPDAKKTPLLDDKQLQKKFPNAFKDAIKSRDALIEAKRKITIRRLKQMYDNKTDEEKAIEVFSKTLNVPRTLMASMDVSAPLRQAIVATTAHPILANKALKFMFEAAANEKVYNRWLDDVHNSPRWEVAQKINLAITDPESLHVKEAEEAFQGAPYAEKIPIVGIGVKASERAYIGYLNKLRWDIFNMYADRFEARGKVYENNPKLYEGLSSFINSATGRGNMKGLESAAPIFNWVLFASKLIASRMNMLGLSDLPNLVVRGATFGKYGLDYGFYSKLPPEIRIEAAKDMLKFLAVGTATLLIAKQFGTEIELDPRSSDFGKIKVGNTRWDIWGGFQPYARVLTQVVSGERKATTTGKIYELDGEHFMNENRLSPLASFARGKLAPIPSAAINLFSGRDVIGNKVTWSDQLQNNLMPLIINDVRKGMEDQGVKALFTVGIPSAFGVGVQTYDNSNKGGKGGGGGASGGREPQPREKKEKTEPSMK